MKRADLGLKSTAQRWRKRDLLDVMNLVVLWAELVALVSANTPDGRGGRPPFAIANMLRMHLMELCIGLSDPGMNEALHDVLLYREFYGLYNSMMRVTDESANLRSRYLLA